MEEKPRRRWWRKKRWWAAAAVWLALPVLFVLADGPVYYCCLREWLPMTERARLAKPARRLSRAVGLGEVHYQHNLWWYNLAVRHGGLIAVPDPETFSFRFVRQDGSEEAQLARQGWERAFGDASE